MCWIVFISPLFLKLFLKFWTWNFRLTFFFLLIFLKWWTLQCSQWECLAVIFTCFSAHVFFSRLDFKIFLLSLVLSNLIMILSLIQLFSCLFLWNGLLISVDLEFSSNLKNFGHCFFKYLFWFFSSSSYWFSVLIFLYFSLYII